MYSHIIMTRPRISGMIYPTCLFQCQHRGTSHFITCILSAQWRRMIMDDVRGRWTFFAAESYIVDTYIQVKVVKVLYIGRFYNPLRRWDDLGNELLHQGIQIVYKFRHLLLGTAKLKVEHLEHGGKRVLDSHKSCASPRAEHQKVAGYGYTFQWNRA